MGSEGLGHFRPTWRAKQPRPVAVEAHELTPEGTADARNLLWIRSGKRFVQAQHVECSGRVSESEDIVCGLHIDGDSRCPKSRLPCTSLSLGAAQNSADEIEYNCGRWRVRLQGAAR